MKRVENSKENRRRRKSKVISGGLVRLKSTKKFHADTSSVSASHSANNEYGILRSDAETSPDALNRTGDVKPLVLLPGRIMLAITFLGMIFIAIITWFVSRMPSIK